MNVVGIFPDYANYVRVDIRYEGYDKIRKIDSCTPETRRQVIVVCL